MNKIHLVILGVIFSLSIGLRLSLAIVNREANDDHLQVVNLILQQGQLPSKTDCEECTQPKLFHGLVALFLKLTSITDPETKIIIAQLINVFISIVMLWVLWLFFRSLSVNWDGLKLLTFGLVALNPRLIAINIQATNDTFVIAFSTFALYNTHLYIQQKNYRHLIWAIVFSIATVLSKINGIVTIIAIGIALFLDSYYSNISIHRKLEKSFRVLGIYLISVLIFVIPNPLGQFITNYQSYGTPFTLNIAVSPQPFPKLFEETDTYKPGILSIQDAFFTFKLHDLIINPQITTKNKIYPPHRTSFWTILYGRVNFIQYGQWPPSWVTSDPMIKSLGRRIFVLALLPLTIFLFGCVVEMKRTFKLVFNSKKAATLPTSTGLFLLTGMGYLAFQIAYALRYRTYYIIKPIYMFPAILAFGLFFMIGFDTIYRLFLDKRPWLNSLFTIPIVFLIGLYSLDIIALLIQLTIAG